MEENGVEEPLAQAYNGGMILRNMLGDKWDSNPASAYVGALLNHFQENVSFDLFAIDNDVLSSFAAFCQKGDNIERLEEYLVQTGFCNYKLAYGIYGATRGFASLPKTFTSVLIDGNKDYYQSFASNVWRMLNGVEIKDAILPKTNSRTSGIVESPFESKIIENINNVEPKVTKQQKVVEAINKAIELEDAVQSPKAFMYILDSFPNMTRTKAYKNLVEADFANDLGTYTIDEFKQKIYSIIGKAALKGQQDKIDTAIELEAKRQDSEAFLYILDNFLDKSSNAYKKIKDIISKKNLSTNRPPKKDGVNRGSYSNQQSTKYVIGQYFISDLGCWNFLKNMIPSSCQNEFYRDLKWFQDEYAKGESSQYYARASRENNATIEAFGRYLAKKKYSSQIRIQDITDYLRRIYVR